MPERTSIHELNDYNSNGNLGSAICRLLEDHAMPCNPCNALPVLVASCYLEDSVNFTEFLHLMRSMLDSNFAGIAELSSTAAVFQC